MSAAADAVAALAEALAAGLAGDDDRDAVPSPVELEDLRRPDAPRVPVLCLNFHHTPTARRADYARQLEALRGRAQGADEARLRALLAGEEQLADDAHPVVLPVLFEGYRSSYEVALPLIEALGLTAWLVVPPALLDVPVAEQAAFAEAHELVPSVDDDPRVAMTWDELRDCVARGHVVCCHTASHVGHSALAGPEDVERELVASRARLEEQLGIDVRTICFVWGPAWGEDARIDAAVLDAGYDLLISNGRYQRLPAAPRRADPWPRSSSAPSASATTTTTPPSTTSP